LNDVWFGGDEAGGLRVSRTAVMVRVLVASAGRCLAVASGQVVRIEFFQVLGFIEELALPQR
jgi:hypothetical protein